MRRCRDSPGQSRPDFDAFFNPEPRSLPRRVLDHVRGPWTRRRAWGLVCAAFAAVPGVRRHVLNTTPIREHPMWKYHQPRRRDDGVKDAGPGR